jgi:tRNA nucleotidyltransferase (CCA-adding enzyme)
MSDYMFMLENHLNADQMRVVNEVQILAGEANAPLYLTGGALRDMLGGFPTRDLDFTIEANPLKMGKILAERLKADILICDELRKRVELIAPGGQTVELAMARTERYAKPGAKPQVSPASIYDDLRRRDFTINSIALSLNKASRGLLLDPNMGQSDLEHRELRTVTSYTFYDDPGRLLRFIRLRVRLGLAIPERTQNQYQNAREAGMEKLIGPRVLWDELRHIAAEPNPPDLLQALETEGLLSLFSPALTGPKLNLPGFTKLQKTKQYIPFGLDIRLDNASLFLYMLTEKLSAKERAALVAATKMEPQETQGWQRLEGRAKKLETELKSARLQKASQVYRLLSKAPGDQLIFLLARSDQRLVQDRIKNYLQKYLPASFEVTDRDVEARGVKPGTPKFDKKRDEMIASRLDSRPKKPPVVPPPPEPTPVPSGSARGAGPRAGG